MECWINSNNGDYIAKYDHGRIFLNIVSKKLSDGSWTLHEWIKLSEQQLKSIKGFVPIKEKKIKNKHRFSSIYFSKDYRPTLKGGDKGFPIETIIPTMSDIRDNKINLLGL